MRLLSKGIAIAVMTCIAMPSFAATLQPIQADVLINRGRGYQKVAGPTQAISGDVVMANPSGRGELVYDDGCRIPIDPGMVVVVEDESPCRRGVGWTPVVGGLAALAGAITAGVVLTQHSSPPPPLLSANPAPASP